MAEEVTPAMTKLQLFKLCGKMTSPGHYPVCGWLRVEAGFLKRMCYDGGWDEPLSPRVSRMVEELLTKVKQQDPVGRRMECASGGRVPGLV